MSARGARSRKVAVKEIEKKEKKTAAKQFADSFARPGTAFSDWTGHSTPQPQTGHTSRTVSQITSTSSLDSAKVPVRSGRSGAMTFATAGDFRPFHRSNTSASGSTISASSSMKERAKYQAKGKNTKAPRGRGGGVPIKKSSSAPQFIGRAGSALATESSSSLGSNTGRTWANFTVWHGTDHGVRPYRGFQFDEDLQMGSVMIYFKEEQLDDDNPKPQLRVRYDALETSGSTWLINQLNYGVMDTFDDEMTPPMSPESSTYGLRYSSMNSNTRYLPDPLDPGNLSPQDFQDQYMEAPPHRSTSRSGGFYAVDTGSRRHVKSGASGPTPPASTTASSQDAGSVYEQREPVRPTHELWFAAPTHMRSPQSQRLFHVAVRNFLAILHNKPIVGRDLYEMLSTLQPEIEVMYDLDHNEHSQTSARIRSVQVITKYLHNRKLDDLRNSIRRALGLLAWAEQDTIRWDAGYTEAFVHLVGMMGPDVEEMSEFRRLSAVTRRNLSMSANALQLTTLDAEERLSTFDFSDMWDEPKNSVNNPIYKSFVAFRHFLIDFFTKAYGSWPPSLDKRWLNRKAVQSLQNDFGALYDYLVNRDIVWDSQEERPGKKWQMSCQDSSQEFQADSAELPLTDMLVGFDNRHGYLHIPHPYPLLPRFVNAPKSVAKKSFFSSLKKSKNDPNKDAKTHLQLSIVFSDATNIQRLGVSFAGNALIDHFEQFELAADLKGVSPREARLGRWVLLYGILQVLSKLSVDTQGLKYSEGVQYFLCADLKRTPPWETTGAHGLVEASQLASWCWQRDWDESRPNVVQELEAQHTIRRELDAIGTQREVQRAPEKRAESENSGKAHGFDRINIGRAQEYGCMNEYKGFEFGEAKLGSRTPDSNPADFELDDAIYRPHVPARSPLRTPRSQGASGSTTGGGYFAEDRTF